MDNALIAVDVDISEGALRYSRVTTDPDQSLRAFEIMKAAPNQVQCCTF
jgi:hypothetical protein